MGQLSQCAGRGLVLILAALLAQCALVLSAPATANYAECPDGCGEALGLGRCDDGHCFCSPGRGGRACTFSTKTLLGDVDFYTELKINESQTPRAHEGPHSLGSALDASALLDYLFFHTVRGSKPQLIVHMGCSAHAAYQWATPLRARASGVLLCVDDFLPPLLVAANSEQHTSAYTAAASAGAGGEGGVFASQLRSVLTAVAGAGLRQYVVPLPSLPQRTHLALAAHGVSPDVVYLAPHLHGNNKDELASLLLPWWRLLAPGGILAVRDDAAAVASGGAGGAELQAGVAALAQFLAVTPVAMHTHYLLPKPIAAVGAAAPPGDVPGTGASQLGAVPGGGAALLQGFLPGGGAAQVGAIPGGGATLLQGFLPGGGAAQMGAVPGGAAAQVGAVPGGGAAQMGAVPGGGVAQMGAVPGGGAAQVGAVPGGGAAQVGAVPGSIDGTSRPEATWGGALATVAAAAAALQPQPAFPALAPTAAAAAIAAPAAAAAAPFTAAAAAAPGPLVCDPALAVLPGGWSPCSMSRIGVDTGAQQVRASFVSSGPWGNLLAIYYQGLSIAQLMGYTFRYISGFSEDWLVHLPAVVPPGLACPNVSEVQRTCALCTLPPLWEFTMNCPAGWTKARPAIRNVTRTALESWAAANAKALPTFEPTDAVIQVRCAKDTLLDHGMYGPSGFSMYGKYLPADTKRVFAVYAHHTHGTPADYPPCNRLVEAMGRYITARRPDVLFATVGGEKWEDYARLVYAPVAFRDSMSSWGLWATLASAGRVFAPPVQAPVADSDKLLLLVRPEVDESYVFVDVPVLYPELAKRLGMPTGPGVLEAPGWEALTQQVIAWCEAN